MTGVPPQAYVTENSYQAQSQIARQLAHYIERVDSLVPNKSKFWNCLPSIILDFYKDRDVETLAREINEHG